VEKEPRVGAVPVIREFHNQDLVSLSYGTRVILSTPAHRDNACSLDEKKVLRATDKGGMSFLMLNAKNPRDRGLVSYNDTVCFTTDQNEFLMYRSANQRQRGQGGEVCVDRLRKGQEPFVKWTVFPAASPSSRRGGRSRARPVGVVKVFDAIALRSNGALDERDGGFLTVVQADGSTRCKGMQLSEASAWMIARGSFPFVSEWTRKHDQAQSGLANPLLTPNTLARQQETLRNDHRAHVLNDLPSAVQEQLLLDDLLHAMMGIDGRYIHKKAAVMDEALLGREGARDRKPTLASFEFTLGTKISDASLVRLIGDVLPVCEHYCYLKHYVTVHSRFEYGLVSHAFAAAVRSMLREYLVLVAQLEHQLRKEQLSLMRVIYYVQPSLHTMETLYRICCRCANTSGGALLNRIHEGLTQEGDVKTRALATYLLTESSKPYNVMLTNWICCGVVLDPHDEFQITVREDLKKENLRKDFNDTYWDERFTLREDKVPVFLEGLADKILIAGKYLNVINECGRRVTFGNPGEMRLHYHPQNIDSYTHAIEAAYEFASHELLSLLLGEEQLLERLRSIRRYFLLFQGDCFLHFNDIAGEELSKPVHDISVHKLSGLLESAIRATDANLDLFKEDVDCYLQPMTLLQKLWAIHRTNHRTNDSKTPSSSSSFSGGVSTAMGLNTQTLRGFEAFALKYDVRWPVSLVISKKTLTKYSLLFRHIFFCKHVERVVSTAWKDCARFFASGHSRLRDALVKSFGLRHRMLNFVHNLMYYMMTEVLDPKWMELEAKLQTATTVDQVLALHNAVLDSCLKECLITNHPLLELLIGLMYSSLHFCEGIEEFAVSVRTEASFGNHRRRSLSNRKSGFKPSLTDITEVTTPTQERYINLVAKYVKEFDSNLAQFVRHIRDKAQVQYDHHLAQLYTRLDFNSYYSKNGL
jgi:gamma-tubulin complex component 2